MPSLAAAQPTALDSPAALDLIRQLQPRTRGIRVPSEQPTTTATTPAPARVATTTAPPGVSAASVSVRFGTGSAELSAGAARSLDTLGQALVSQQLTPYRFRIEGHTDTVGSTELNRSLSERRARVVREYLTTHYRIAPDRLEAVGLGESQLLVATPDETAEARNRRVQVLNLGS